MKSRRMEHFRDCARIGGPGLVGKCGAGIDIAGSQPDIGEDAGRGRCVAGRESAHIRDIPSATFPVCQSTGTEHRKAVPGVTVRKGILWGLRSLAVILCVLVVSCGLWWGLAALGDHGGSAGARGVAYVALVCLAIDLIGLVVLLSVCQLQGEIPTSITSLPEPRSSGSADAD